LGKDRIEGWTGDMGCSQSGVKLCVPVSKNIFLDLPHRITGQIVHEYDAFGQLELGKALFEHANHALFA
jgi:hypothetical protein